MYNNLRNSIKAAIKSNNSRAITGDLLQSKLIEIVNNLDLGGLFLGIASTSTTPDSQANGFYITSEAGTYNNFPGSDGNPITIKGSEIIYRKSQNEWDHEEIIEIDDNISETSENPVQSKVISQALDEKLNKPSEYTQDNLVKFNESGEIEDSGKSVSDFATSEQVEQNTSDIQELQAAYQGLTQSDIIVVADHTAVSNPETNTIYREYGTTSYSDWMYFDGSWIKMAEYNNAVDNVPTKNSDNLVKSGGVYNQISQLDQEVAENGAYYLPWSDIKSFKYALSSDGTFIETTATLKNSHKVIPVSAGQILYIKRGTDNCYFGIVKSYTIPSVGDSADFADGESARYLSGMETQAITIPSGAKFVIVCENYSGSNRSPSILKINDYDVLSGIVRSQTIGASRIEDGAVTEDKLSTPVKDIIDNKVDKKTINLIDWDNVVFWENRYYKASSGVLASGSGGRTYMAVPLIKIKPNTAYYLSCIRDGVQSGLGTGASTDAGICFYRSNSVDSFIEGSTLSANTCSFTSPADANYIGITCYNYDNISNPCFQEGTSRYYVGYNPIGGYMNPDVIPDNSILTTKINDGAVIEDKTIFFNKSRNLFDKTAVTLGKYVTASGLIGSNVNYVASDYIPIDAAQEYIISNKYGTAGAYNAFYKENKEFISSFQSMPVAIPSNAAYLRISLNYLQNLTYLDNVQVEYGQATTDYEKYGYLLKDKYIPQSEDVVSNQIIVPKYLYLLSGVNNDVFYEPILRKWNPYQYDVFANTTPNERDYVKAIKGVVTLNNPTATGLSLSLYDLEKADFIQTKNITFRKGTQGVGNSEIKVGIIGDSYTDGGCFTPALLANGYVPNIKLVGTRSVNTTTYVNQRTDGRSGWALSTFSTPQTRADYYNPFVHPQGNHRFWGNTAFWANVCGGSPSGYGTRYTHYASLCDGNGWPVSPIEGDVIYDSVNSTYKEYQSGSWVSVQQTDYTWEFNFAKYLAMWNIETPDIMCIMLGVNDFWVNNFPSDENLSVWKTRMNAIITSYKASNPNGKFVILTANTVTHSNVLHYRPLDVHNRMQILRDFVIKEWDNKESDGIYVVDTAQLIDSEHAFVLTEVTPFDGFTGDAKEIYAGDGQHPRLNYTTLGYSLAAFIQYFRN